MQNPVETFKALADETRLRILRLLMEEPLNVGELTAILGIAQPTVSKHLGELRKSDLVECSRRAGYSYYQVSAQLRELWSSPARLFGGINAQNGDLTRLQEILKQRKEYSEADRFVVPGRSWVVWSRALRFLLPPLRIADLGCGDGAFTVEMARWAEKVYAIDSNAAFLQMARSAARGLSNVEFLQESMEALPLADQSVDLVTISQSLHYVERPWLALAEAHRLLVPAGQVLVIELLPHDQRWVKEELQHHWLGFDPKQLKEWLRQAGFDKIEIDSQFRRSSDSFQPFIAVAYKEKTE